MRPCLCKDEKTVVNVKCREEWITIGTILVSSFPELSISITAGMDS